MLSISILISRVKFVHGISRPKWCTIFFRPSHTTPPPLPAISVLLALYWLYLPLSLNLHYNDISMVGFLSFAVTHFVVLFWPFVTNSDESEGSLAFSVWAALHCPHRIPVGARLTASTQNGPRAYPAFFTMGTVSLLRVNLRGMAFTAHPI